MATYMVESPTQLLDEQRLVSRTRGGTQGRSRLKTRAERGNLGWKSLEQFKPIFGRAKYGAVSV